MKLTKLSLGLLLSLIPLCLALVIRVFSLSPEENSPKVISPDSLMSMATKSEVVLPVQEENMMEEKERPPDSPKTPPETSQRKVQPSPEKEAVEKVQLISEVDSQDTQPIENDIPAAKAEENQKIEETEALPTEPLQKEESPVQSTGFNTGVYQQEEKILKEPELGNSSRTEFRALIQGKKVQQGSLIQVVLQENIPQYDLQAGTYLQAECEFRNQRLQLSITQAKINGRFKRIKLIGYDTKDGIMGITQPGNSGGLPSEWVIPNGHPLHLRFD